MIWKTKKKLEKFAILAQKPQAVLEYWYIKRGLLPHNLDEFFFKIIYFRFINESADGLKSWVPNPDVTNLPV